MAGKELSFFQVLSGATVSPDAFAAMKRQEPIKCNWCHADVVSTLHHVTWEYIGSQQDRCQVLGCYANTQNREELQTRLGWPGRRVSLVNDSHECILRWLSCVGKKSSMQGTHDKVGCCKVSVLRKAWRCCCCGAAKRGDGALSTSSMSLTISFIHTISFEIFLANWNLFVLYFGASAPQKKAKIPIKTLVIWVPGIRTPLTLPLPEWIVRFHS